MTWLKERMGAVGRSSVYPLIPLTATALTALLGTLYTDAIRSSPPLSWIPSGMGQWLPLGFWGLFFLSALLYFPREAALDADRRRATDDLVALVRTLPPVDFLEHNAASFAAVSALGSWARKENSAEAYEEAIRQVLRTIAILARKFDVAPDVRYAANIMRLVRHDPTRPARSKDINARIAFCEDEVTLESLDGALDVQTGLSATTDVAPDPELGPFALPVPKQRSATTALGPKWRVLPGAPIAWVTEKPSLFVDANGLIGWCRESGDFSEGVIQKIGIYLGTPRGSLVKSFVSVRLSDDAVLNIHRDQPGLLREHLPAEQFISTIGAFNILLTDLLKSLDETMP